MVSSVIKIRAYSLIDQLIVINHKTVKTQIHIQNLKLLKSHIPISIHKLHQRLIILKQHFNLPHRSPLHSGFPWCIKWEYTVGARVYWLPATFYSSHKYNWWNILCLVGRTTYLQYKRTAQREILSRTELAFKQRSSFIRKNSFSYGLNAAVISRHTSKLADRIYKLQGRVKQLSTVEVSTD